jgi:hypothetical protein
LDSQEGRTLAVKLAFVAMSGLSAGAHAMIQAPRHREKRAGGSGISVVLGSISLVAALLAALYGVVIANA